MAPKILRAESLESVSVSSHGKRELAGMIILRILRWGDDPGLFQLVPNIITSVLIKGRQKEI